MTSHNPDLAALGWNRFFSAQMTSEELERHLPVRVMAAHRGLLDVAGDGMSLAIPSYLPGAETDEDHPTVGDWLLVDRKALRPVRLLERTSLFRRRAPGTGRKLQLIAANVDTLLIVSSCNQDFNIARLERFLVLARDAGVTPVVILTKADLVENPDTYAAAARTLQPGMLVETVNALDAPSVASIAAWCGKGQTVAFVGSSGVGKSTLINTLTGSDGIVTRTIRADDDKGRHSTTARALHRLQQGGWLLDTPGMRELQLIDAADGIDMVFEDIVALAGSCRFADCTHESEPGCAVKSAIEAGELDPERLKRWRKLAAEEVFNSESLAERRARDRAFGKRVRAVSKGKQHGKWS